MHADHHASPAGVAFAIILSLALAAILIVIAYRRFVLQKRGWSQVRVE